MTAQFIRRRDAARRFQVSTSTLDRWARAGLIGRTTVGRCVFYRVADIAELIARNEQPRTVLTVTLVRYPTHSSDTAAARVFFAPARRS